MMPNRNSKSGLAALALFALVATPVALHATPASARVDVGVNFGVPVIVAPPPVVYAAPPVVYAARAAGAAGVCRAAAAGGVCAGARRRGWRRLLGL